MERDVHVVDHKRQVRDGLHDLWHLAVRVEAHPFDAVGTGLKAADMNTELLQVQLAVSRRGVWGCRDGGIATRTSQPLGDLRGSVACQPSMI